MQCLQQNGGALRVAEGPGQSAGTAQRVFFGLGLAEKEGKPVGVAGLCEPGKGEIRVRAPVEEGQLLGKVVVSKEGTVLGEYPIRAKNAVEKIDFGKGMEILFGTLLGKVEPF